MSATRHFTADLLRRWGIGEDERDSAVLIVAELAANAAQHGRADMTLLLALDHGMLQITVTDSGRPVPHRRRADADPDEHGRGTGIIELLAQWTEVHQSEYGRQVRAGLRVADPQPAEPAGRIHGRPPVRR
ncbi:ATP-binding protein [Streptomyces sp. NPDC050636]|uniref:ATP-binding protein n=1 Tax=Streptomyces sp. NPDC050636 TaxID=3154510 RepID=UPI003432069A